MDYQYYDEADYMDDEGGVDGLDEFYADPKYHSRYARHTDYPGDDDIAGHYGSAGDRLWDSVEHCVLPSLSQVLGYLLPLLLGCLLCRLLSQLYAQRQRQRLQRLLSGAVSGSSWQEANSLQMAPLHAINALCGLGMLYATLGERLLLLLLLSGVSYALLQLVRLGKGQRAAVAIAVLCIGSQFVYELLLLEQRNDWPQLRGLQMVANMKVISLGFDLASGGTPMTTTTTTAALALRMPSPWAYLGYVFQPASCILGPWLSYGRYLEALASKPPWRRCLLQTLCNLLLCLLALTVSNCMAPAWGELGGHWLLMYTGALSVRSSHYFVSFLSQALLATAGQQLDTSRHSSVTPLQGAQVARPWHIEWPHSLSALVRGWNVPMHEWLKRYVYRASRQRSRHHTIVAVFCTYIVSSLLHGMDFRIYLVLLSLATFGEGEAMLRRHLATLCNACIAANPCPGAERCRYARCPRRRGWRCASSWLVALTNLAFTLLDICHLAYLGVVLLNETLGVGLDAEHEHELPFMYHWAAAGYLNHYIGIGMFMLYLFIS
ncbi:hypothetical protein KR093_005057 [Drosophila rubida]|uniref:Protein-serine O-palmitoleoyltransferase porcupine n=1 Tax=Drosophila rubida TaxID=30044 RepID=A0AAD4KA75_9MUSC|nr:hypothetical protein KR093_005057 [Drosophila rubida]